MRILKNIKAILNSKQLEWLIDHQKDIENMIELKNKIEALFGLKNNETRVAFLLDQFIGEIKEDENNGQTQNANGEQSR